MENDIQDTKTKLTHPTSTSLNRREFLGGMLAALAAANLKQINWVDSTRQTQRTQEAQSIPQYRAEIETQVLFEPLKRIPKATLGFSNLGTNAGGWKEEGGLYELFENWDAHKDNIPPRISFFLNSTFSEDVWGLAGTNMGYFMDKVLPKLKESNVEEIRFEMQDVFALNDVNRMSTIDFYVAVLSDYKKKIDELWPDVWSRPYMHISLDSPLVNMAILKLQDQHPEYFAADGKLNFECVKDTVKVIKILREKFPDFKIGFTHPFIHDFMVYDPALENKLLDPEDALDELFRLCKKENIEGPDFLDIDFPANFFTMENAPSEILGFINLLKNQYHIPQLNLFANIIHGYQGTDITPTISQNLYRQAISNFLDLWKLNKTVLEKVDNLIFQFWITGIPNVPKKKGDASIISFYEEIQKALKNPSYAEQIYRENQIAYRPES